MIFTLQKHTLPWYKKHDNKVTLSYSQPTVPQHTKKIQDNKSFRVHNLVVCWIIIQVLSYPVLCYLGTQSFFLSYQCWAQEPQCVQNIDYYELMLPRGPQIPTYKLLVFTEAWNWELLHFFALNIPKTVVKRNWYVWKSLTINASMITKISGFGFKGLTILFLILAL